MTLSTLTQNTENNIVHVNRKRQALKKLGKKLLNRSNPIERKVNGKYKDLNILGDKKSGFKRSNKAVKHQGIW